MARLNYATWFALLILVGHPALAMIHTNQFQKWYQQYGFIFEQIKHDNCTEQFSNYLTGRPQDFPIDSFGGGGTKSRLTQPVMQCILDNSSEYLKSIMATAQVTLGVMPTILSILGPSTEELAMLGVVARRPLLAFILALGSPSVFLSRAFDYKHPDEILARHKYRQPQWKPCPAAQWAICIAEYVLAIAAVVNIALVSRDLGVRTVCSWISNLIIAPMVWGLLGLAIHLFGAVTLRMRARREHLLEGDGDHKVGTPLEWLRDWPRRAREICALELVPSVAQSEIRMQVFPERKLYLLLSWLLSTGIVFHLAFGTLLFSGLTFIGPKDSMGVVVRYIVSVLVCRVILMYEIAGMRERFVEIVK